MRDHAVRTGPDRRTPLITRGVGAVLVGTALMLVAVPTSAPAATATQRRVVVKIEETSGPLGGVLATAKGRTLYVDTRDRADHVTCTANCARLWPPLLLARGITRPVAGSGVRGLGTVRRPGHRLQVTWHKLPLYLYTGDIRPGQASGEGVGTTFFVVTSKGVLRSSPSTTTPTSTSTSTPATVASGASTTTAANPPSTTPAPGGTIRGGGTASTAPAATVPAPPATSPPATSPPATSPPATSPPTTTPPVGGGVAY